jgi:lipoate-protein ligase A
VRVFDLGRVPWLESQLLYHAMPRVGVEGLVLLAPAEPYVCIGRHQDPFQEIDLEACRQLGLPVFRREVGGGAVYLDGAQVFFQVVLHRDDPAAGGDKEALYRRMLAPVAAAYGDLGVPARYRPVNDVVTADGRKVSGTGAAEIGDFVVMVGNLIEDFDYDAMVRVLRVPDEKFRDRVQRSMRENLTTLRRETGRRFTWAEMAGALVRRFHAVLEPLEPAILPAEVRAEAARLEPVLTGAEWFARAGRRTSAEREVRITGDARVTQRVHKAPGGLVRAIVEVKDDRIVRASLSGDFFCYPGDGLPGLEDALAGAPLARVEQVLASFFAAGRLVVPGVGIPDWLAVLGAA